MSGFITKTQTVLRETRVSSSSPAECMSNTSGLRSLCTTPTSCMWLTADTNFRMMRLASVSLKCCFLRILSSSSPPPSSSRTRYVWSYNKHTHTGHIYTLFTQVCVLIIINLAFTAGTACWKQLNVNVWNGGRKLINIAKTAHPWWNHNGIE